jgi:hypothetical protein
MFFIKKIRPLIDFIIYGNVFIALCAAASTYSTAISLNLNDLELNKNLNIACFVGAATFFLYNLHKPVTYFLRKQFIENARFTRTKAFQGPLSILSILAAIYCVFFFFQLKTNSQIGLIGMAFLSLGYVLPILGNGRRLRDVAFLKIFLIAFVWAVITVGLPFLESNQTTTDNYFWALFIERLCFIFALCIPFDIRDMDWDIKTNVQTIPLSIGVKKAKILGILAVCVAAFVTYSFRNVFIFNEINHLKGLIVYATTILVILKADKNRSDYFFYGGVDGMILLHSLIA